MSNSSIWLMLAGLLLVAEITTGTFYLLIVAIGAALGAGIAHLGFSTEIQIGSAAVFATITSLILQSSRKKNDAESSAMSDKLDIGNLLNVESWDENGLSQVMYRGALWKAQTADDAPRTGLHQIADVKGNLLILKAETKKQTSN